MTDGLTKEEINRKLLHGLAVILPIGIFYGPGHFEVHRNMACFVIGALFLFSLSVEVVRLKNPSFHGWFSRCFGSMMRKQETSELTGATYVLAGSAICSLISLHDESAAAASFLALTLFILGDAVAALVGKGIGRIKVGNKTIEGALGCFIFCVLIAGVVFPQLSGFIANWGGKLTWGQIIGVSATVSILEFIPLKLGKLVLNDNLYVPAVASLVALTIR